MRTFTIHVSSAAGLAPEERIATARAVKEGFSWPAFFFAFIWALYHRLWGLAGAIFGIELLVGLVVEAFGLDTLSDLAVSFGVAAILGFLANDFLRAGLARRGYLDRGAIRESSSEDAIRAYFIANAPRDGYVIEGGT